MKIAFLNTYSGINDRGAENFSHDLALRLAKKHQIIFYAGGKLTIPDVQARVVSVGKPAQPQQGFFNNTLRNWRKRVFLDPASFDSLVFSLKVLPGLLQEKFDWLIPMNGFWEVLICKFATLFTKSRILITGHSGPGWDERWNLYLCPDIFVATTEPTLAWAQETAPWIKSTLIPYGIDVEKFSRAEPHKLKLPRPIILCPAAAVEYKRVDLAIKAVAGLGFGSLVHLGAGHLSREIEAEGEKLLGDRFISKEILPGDVAGYFLASDLVTLPSTGQENSPMVFLEAMAAGKFVVATKSARNQWILGDAGILTDPADIPGYILALKEGLKRNDQSTINIQLDKFLWGKVMAKYEGILQSKNDHD